MSIFAPAWSVWGGNNAFYFSGRCIAGPSLIPPLVTGGGVLLSGILVASVIAADLTSAPSLLIALSLLSALIAIVCLGLLHTSDPGVLPRAPMLIAYANTRGKARENYALAALSARLHLKNIVAALVPYLRLVAPLPQAKVATWIGARAAAEDNDDDHRGQAVRSYAASIPYRTRQRERPNQQRGRRAHGQRERHGHDSSPSESSTHTDDDEEPSERRQDRFNRRDSGRPANATAADVGAEPNQSESITPMASLTLPIALTATEAVVGPRVPVWGLELVAALGEGIVPTLKYPVPLELADSDDQSAAKGVRIDRSGVLEPSPGETAISDVAAGGLAAARWCWQCHIPHPRLSSGHCGVCGVCIEHWDQHCRWAGTCIGAGNVRLFLVTLFALTAFCSIILATCMQHITELISRYPSLVVAFKAQGFAFTLDFVVVPFSSVALVGLISLTVLQVRALGPGQGATTRLILAGKDPVLPALSVRATLAAEGAERHRAKRHRRSQYSARQRQEQGRHGSARAGQNEDDEESDDEAGGIAMRALGKYRRLQGAVWARRVQGFLAMAAPVPAPALASEEVNAEDEDEDGDEDEDEDGDESEDEEEEVASCEVGRCEIETSRNDAGNDGLSVSDGAFDGVDIAPAHSHPAHGHPPHGGRLGVVSLTAAAAAPSLSLSLTHSCIHSCAYSRSHAQRTQKEQDGRGNDSVSCDSDAISPVAAAAAAAAGSAADELGSDSTVSVSISRISVLYSPRGAYKDAFVAKGAYTSKGRGKASKDRSRSHGRSPGQGPSPGNGPSPGQGRRRGSVLTLPGSPNTPFSVHAQGSVPATAVAASVRCDCEQTGGGDCGHSVPSPSLSLHSLSSDFSAPLSFSTKRGFGGELSQTVRAEEEAAVSEAEKPVSEPDPVPEPAPPAEKTETKRKEKRINKAKRAALPLAKEAPAAPQAPIVHAPPLRVRPPAPAPSSAAPAAAAEIVLSPRSRLLLARFSGLCGVIRRVFTCLRVCLCGSPRLGQPLALRRRAAALPSRERVWPPREKAQVRVDRALDVAELVGVDTRDPRTGSARGDVNGSSATYGWGFGAQPPSKGSDITAINGGASAVAIACTLPPRPAPPQPLEAWGLRSPYLPVAAVAAPNSTSNNSNGNGGRGGAVSAGARGYQGCWACGCWAGREGRNRGVTLFPVWQAPVDVEALNVAEQAFEYLVDMASDDEEDEDGTGDRGRSGSDRGQSKGASLAARTRRVEYDYGDDSDDDV